jgi:alpha-glucosidase
MYDALRFWLDRGVDGFRVDVIWHLIKDAAFRDNPPNPAYQPSQAEINRFLQVHSADQPEVHEVVSEMRAVLEEYPERVLIGEIYLPLERLVAYYGKDLAGAHLPFNFQLIQTAWNAQEIASLINEYEAALPEGGWPNWVLGNHDQPRIGARIGPKQARVAAMLLLTLRGTPTMYYGDEIGMRDVPIPPDEVQDPQGLNMPDKDLSRDPARTPMQWDDTVNAGFTDAKPWLRLPDNFRRVNVAVQREDEFSMLSFYRRLIKLRQEEPALHIGDYAPVFTKGSLLTFLRKHEDTQFLVILNLSHKPCLFRTEHHTYHGTVTLATDPEREGSKLGKNISMAGDEGIIVRLD